MSDPAGHAPTTWRRCSASLAVGAGCSRSAPLAWFWRAPPRRRAGARGCSALTLLTLFLTFDLVLFGAFTRLTDSGLGCPDWPGCYGHASPIGAQRAHRRGPGGDATGPVTHGKAWIEMLHRYFATGDRRARHRRSPRSRSSTARGDGSARQPRVGARDAGLGLRCRAPSAR